MNKWTAYASLPYVLWAAAAIGIAWGVVEFGADLVSLVKWAASFAQ